MFANLQPIIILQYPYFSTDCHLANSSTTSDCHRAAAKGDQFQLLRLLLRLFFGSRSRPDIYFLDSDFRIGDTSGISLSF